MKSARTLPSSEWDFRPLVRKRATVADTHQLTAATFYEYARESASVRALAARYAALEPQLHTLVEEQGSLYPLRLQRPVDAEIARLDVAPFWNCILWPQFFPQTPWLDIPLAQRTTRLERFLATEPRPIILAINETTATELHEHAQEVAADREERTGRRRAPRAGDRDRRGTGEFLIMWIDWGRANNTDLARAFADWLRASRPKEIPEPRGDGARANVNAAYLTRLGVMRLLHGCAYAEAELVAMKAKVSLPRQSEALELRHRVKADLHLLFQTAVFESVGDVPLLNGNEEPLSFATATQRQRR